MTIPELIRELEYLQDLGLEPLYLEQGMSTLAALVQSAAPPGADGTRQALAAASPTPARERPQGISPAPPTRPPARQPPRPANSIAPPATANKPANPLPAAMPPLLSTQWMNPEAAIKPLDMYDAIGIDPKQDSLARIREDIGDCKRCRLCHGRTNIVFGSGNEQAGLVFVGEGPGEDEDLSGLPFVGKAGQLLTRMIEGTAEKEGLPVRRSSVYICNVVKCRPPKNRKPENDEMEICGQFLFRQLAVLKPKAICVLGATAAQALLNTKQKMGELRGDWQSWRDIPVMVTYHPSYLLRAYSPDAKRLTWEDLKKVLHFVYDNPANLPGA